MLFAATLLALAPAPPPPVDEVRAALERLSGPSVTERRAAEQWLATHLGPGDLEELAEVAAEVGLEARTRLANALGSDDRHFGLAALLASDYAPGLRKIGRSALERMIARWHGEEALLPVALAAVQQSIGDRFQGQLYELRLGTRSLDEELAAVARRMRPPEGLPRRGETLGVSLDPLLYARQIKGVGAGPARLRGAAGKSLEGTPDQLLLMAAVWRERVTIEGFGFNGPRAWLHVVDEDQAGTRTGSDLLLLWCRELLENPDELEGEGAARALAGTGWPAPLSWMADRWFEVGDRNALSGLLLAAERGRVAPGLATSDSVSRLLRAAAASLMERPPATRFAEEVMRAVGAMGPTGSDGADLTEVVAGEWGHSEGAARMRLAILADMGRAPEALRARWRDELAGGAQTKSSARLRLDLLRTLAATSIGAGAGVASWRLADPAPLFRLAAEVGLEGELRGWLRGAGALPPERWENPAALPASWGSGERALVLDWWIDADPTGATAARHLLALASRAGGSDEVLIGDRLAERVRRGDRAGVERVLARCGDPLPASIERVALLAGLLPQSRHLPVFETLVVDGVVADADLPLIAQLASGGKVAEPARLALAAALAASLKRPSGLGLDDAWVHAYERSITALRRRARAAEDGRAVEEQLLRGLRSDLRRTNHPLDSLLRTGSWPPPPGLDSLSIDASDVSLAP